jgi:hypothetical protein
VGGDDRDAVLFSVSVVSRDYVPSPSLLSIATPRDGRSEAASIYLEAAEAALNAPAAKQVESAVLLEIGQGTKVLTVLRVPLES